MQCWAPKLYNIYSISFSIQYTCNSLWYTISWKDDINYVSVSVFLEPLLWKHQIYHAKSLPCPVPQKLPQPVGAMLKLILQNIMSTNFVGGPLSFEVATPLLLALTSRLPPKLANLPRATSSPHISADICKKNPWVDSEPLNSKSPDHGVIFSSDILINGMSSVSFSILVWVKLFLWPETAMSAISNHNQSFKPVPVWLPISVCTLHNPSSHHKPMQQISPPTKFFTANQIHRITEVVNIFNLVLTFRDEPKQCIFCKTQVSCANGGDSDNDDVDEDGDGFDVHNHSSLTSWFEMFFSSSWSESTKKINRNPSAMLSFSVGSNAWNVQKVSFQHKFSRKPKYLHQFNPSPAFMIINDY